MFYKTVIVKERCCTTKYIFYDIFYVNICGIVQENNGNYEYKFHHAPHGINFMS